MSVNSSAFSSVLKLADVTPVYKKDSQKKAIIGLSVSNPNYQKYLKIYFVTKLHHTLKKRFLNMKLVFERILIHRHI